LPPLHSGLLTNYETLFPLLKELAITQQKRNEIIEILDKAFIFPELRKFYFNQDYDLNKITINEKNNKYLYFIPVISSIFIINDIKNLVLKSSNIKELKIEVPVVFLTKDSTININIKSGTKAYPMLNVVYTVNEVIRKKDAYISDFIAKLNIQLADTIIVEKELEYYLFVEIFVGNTKCSIVFISPIGKTNFIFDHVE
jgi:hypothetical protein